MRTPTFADLLRTEVAALQAATPEHEGAIARAHALITQGSVHPMGAGEALVCSSDDPTRWYEINGTCSCPAGTHGQICKHRSAWLLYQRVQKKWQKAEAQHLLLAELTYDPDIEAEEEREALPEPRETVVPSSPLPEAPVSMTIKAMLHGHEILVTLRGTDFASVKAQVEQADAWLQSHAPAMAHADEKVCPLHHVPMKQTTKENRSWWSHRTAQGWCQGK